MLKRFLPNRVVSEPNGADLFAPHLDSFVATLGKRGYAPSTVRQRLRLLRDLAQPASPEERIAKNTDYAKQMLEKGVSHGREVVSIAAKTGADAAEVLHKRATESLDEMRALASKTAA